MARAQAGVLPPVDTWHPQVWCWVHAAWEQAGGLEGGQLGLSQLVRALWSAGDPWSRAYRHLFAGAPAPSRRLALATPEDEVFYSGEPDLVEVMQQAAIAGGGRIHPWALLLEVAERTKGSAQTGRPGWQGVRDAPVEAVGEGTRVRAHRGASEQDVMDWAGGRQVIAVIVDDRLSSSAQRFATPYVEGHFELLAEDQWVLREPGAEAPFWVLEGVSPDAIHSLPDALAEARRRVPGFVPWLPLKAGLDPSAQQLLSAMTVRLRTSPRLALTTDAGARRSPTEADALIVALQGLTGAAEGATTTPILADHPHSDDVLGHEQLAAGLAGALSDEGTEAPLVLAVLGPSGSGRTDLLSRLEAHWIGLLPPDASGTPALKAVRVPAARALLPAIADALAGPVRPAAASTAPTPHQTRAADLSSLLSLMLPGAASEAPARARSSARIGFVCAALGGAGAIAASGHWSALIPASILGLGVVLAGRGAGLGLLQEVDEPAAVQPPPSPSQRLATAESGPRLLLLIDDLDRVPLEQARQRLVELHTALEHPALPPTVAVLACSYDTLQAAAPADRPPSTLVQVPLWLSPMRPRAISKALAHWTGLPAPSVTAPRPTLRAVTDAPGTPPAAVPITLESEDLSEIGPADLSALMLLSPLIPPSPRTWKSVVNQVRLLRPHLPAGVSAQAVAAWLALTAADVAWAREVRAGLVPDSHVAELIHATAPVHLHQSLDTIDPSCWPAADDLLDAADAVLRWTFAGPFPASTAPASTHAHAAARVS